MTKTIAILAAVLMLCCMAQAEVPGVKITGPFLDASIENHTDQALFAVNVAYTDANGVIWRHQMKFTKSPLGLLPGGAEKLHTWSKRQQFNLPGRPATLAAYDVTAVVFMSGELRGDERGDATGRFVSNLENDVPKLHIWKQTGPLAKLRQLPVIADLFAWMIPTVAYAQGSFIHVATWPTTYYNPPYYPSQWTYVCTNPVIGGPGPNPCPPEFSATPDQGVSAYCTTGGYNIGVRINVGNDDYGYPAFQNSSGTSANPYNLRGTGQCSDNATGVVEGWNYYNYCQGNPSAPIKYSDNTTSGNLCGLSISGWFN